MAWVRIDDAFDANRKIRRVWRRAPDGVGLHVMAMSYTARHELDGAVDTDFMEDTVSNDTRRAKLTDALVDAGLWLPTEDGWQINDFLAYNPSREQQEDQREKKRLAGKAGAAARWNT